MMKTTPILCLWLTTALAISSMPFSHHSAASSAKDYKDLPATEYALKQNTEPPQHIIAAAGDGYVVLQWASDATKHRVHYAEASFDEVSADLYQPRGESRYRSIFVPSGNRVVVKNLTNGTRYYFVVTAKRHIIQSHASQEISVVPMGKSPI